MSASEVHPGSPPEQTVAELVEQLGHCACAAAFRAGLNPAQWTALRYFERANRFSRTVSGFARYHGTTRGTASQTVRALVQKGYLNRRPVRHDQRSFRLELTDAARTLLGSDPIDAFVRAAGDLPSEQCADLARGLKTLLDRVLETSARRPVGVCTSCEHLEPADDGAPGCANRCRLQDQVLETDDLDRICVDFRCRKDH